jgi:hypothetical protein
MDALEKRRGTIWGREWGRETKDEQGQMNDGS